MNTIARSAQKSIISILLWFVLPAVAATTTAGIIGSTIAAAPSCLSWRVSGACFWLICGFGCSVRTSLRVSNYAPDLVVSTFHDKASHPWADYGRLLANTSNGFATSLLSTAVDSAGTRTQSDRRDRNKIFRDADGIGHPLAATSLMSSSLGLVCAPAAVTPFRPYFQSFADALVWRGMLPIEMLFPQSLIPGLREVGNWPANTWGNLYPRDGNVTQQNEVKGAAVISQRVGDIVTRAGQPHVYAQIGTGGMTQKDGMLYWLPPELVENAPLTGTWQMVSPVPELSCRAFGANDSALPVSYGDGKVDAAGGYSFNLWRPYSCCQVRGLFIGAIAF